MSDSKTRVRLWTILLAFGAVLVLVTVAIIRLADDESAELPTGRFGAAPSDTFRRSDSRPVSSGKLDTRPTPSGIVEGKGVTGLKGLVRNQDGRPVEGARIEIAAAIDADRQSRRQNATWHLAGAANGSSTLSAADGTFEFSGIEPQRYSLAAVHLHEGSAALPDVEVAAGTTAVVELKLIRRPSIVGRVIGSGDVPLAGARVAALQFTDAEMSGVSLGVLAQASTGEDGLFVMPLLSEQIVFTKCRVSVDGYATAEKDISTHDVMRAPTPHLTVALQRGRPVQLHFIDRDAEAVPMALSFVASFGTTSGFGPHNLSGVTDEHGVAGLDPVPENVALRVWVSGDEWTLDTGLAEPDSLTLVSGALVELPATGAAEGTVRLARAAAVSGRVVDSLTGAGVPLVQVEIGRVGDIVAVNSDSIRRTTTDSDGRFTVRGLWRSRSYAVVNDDAWSSQPDTWRGEIVGNGGFPAASYFPRFDLRADGMAEIVLSVRRRGTATGRILDHQGNGIGGVEITEVAPRDDWRRVVATARGRWPRAKSAADGRFTIAAIDPSPKARLEFREPRFRRRETAEFAVGPGEVADLGDILLERGKSVVIRTHGPEGPVRGVELGVYDGPNGRSGAGGTAEIVVTDEAGEARVGFVSAEAITIEIRGGVDDLVPPFSERVVATTLAETTIEVTLSKRQKIGARLVTDAGTPLVRAYLVVQYLNDDGSLSAEEVPTGETNAAGEIVWDSRQWTKARLLAARISAPSSSREKGPPYVEYLPSAPPELSAGTTQVVVVTRRRD